MSDARCEPPIELRGVDGWHWATNPSGHVVPIKWGLDRKWWLCYSSETPAGIYACGWRYLMPCPTPSDLAAAKDEERSIRLAVSVSNEEICQTLGRALGYPRYADDPANFPDAMDADGVCVGDHVAETIIAEAAAWIAAAKGREAGLVKTLADFAERYCDGWCRREKSSVFDNAGVCSGCEARITLDTHIPGWRDAP